MSITVFVLLLLPCAAIASGVSPPIFDERGGMDLKMGPTHLDHHRFGAFSIFKHDSQVDDCTFESLFGDPQRIEFNCTTSALRSDITASPWEWCGFSWEHPDPESLRMDFLRCDDAAPNVHLESSLESPISVIDATTIKSFLASPVASHLVHLSIVSAVDGHSGYENIAMLQLHHVAKTFMKVAMSEGVDMVNWHNGGDFEELVSLANEQHGRDFSERRVFEMAENHEQSPGEQNFVGDVVEPVVRPQENYFCVARLPPSTRIQFPSAAIRALADVDQIAHVGRW
eukprot:CAMPEP_0116869164 /NCGR_PEP_ID=MMETSP0418-20121206/27609_1 /TAXON_ID=1158023 /ORGANISM="Astrosyne radiata, Strain 13vi08-1A" /LENGTH=284 /DNA_ID=CAMNT_0004505233 /DNA_START=358 /DNA_END=1210 /DNA_ORIENTATION=-